MTVTMDRIDKDELEKDALEHCRRSQPPHQSWLDEAQRRDREMESERDPGIPADTVLEEMRALVGR